MRYFVCLAYNGTRYCGWQIQPGSPSVQETIQQVLTTLLREPIEVTGCGRTDTGVHASKYYLHFDTEKPIPEKFLHAANQILPKDIVLFEMTAVASDLHARYNAWYRSYTYHITSRKDPFSLETAWYSFSVRNVDRDLMQQAAALLMEYEAFAPFCKSNSGLDNMACSIYRSEWEFDDAGHQMKYHVAANRFLRGMVRLIVGMCINVGLGQITLEEVRYALETQTLLRKSLSIPPQGLFLTDVKYQPEPGI